MKRLSKSSALVTLLGATLLVAFAVAGIAGAAAPAPITLSANNCVGAAAGCTADAFVGNPQGVALRGDGSGLVVAVHDSDQLAVFNRAQKFGTLTRRPATSRPACTSEGGVGGCQPGHAFVGPMDVAATSNDNSVYVVSNGSEAIDILNKERDSRQFIQGTGTAGCISDDGTGGQCTDGRGLTGASSVVINPAGGNNFVYVGGANTIAAFKRNLSSGALSQLPIPTGVSTDACVNDDGADGCFDGFVPGNVVNMAFSSDGRFLYAVASGSPGALLVFSRAPQGPITEIACYNADGSNGCVNAGADLDDPTGVGLDRAAKNVYVAANGSGKVVGFVRNKTTGLLTPGIVPSVSVADVNRITIANNNKSAYATSDAGVYSFNRNKKTGELTQGDCMTDAGGGGCHAGNGLAGATSVLSASSYKDVYVAGSADDAVVALKHS